MGKASRRKEKNLKKKEEKDIKKQGRGERAVLAELMEEGRYIEGLDAVVRILKADGGDADVYYRAAYCYYMEEDYDRASQWVNQTLGKEPGHVKAKVLLARICWFKHRTADGLAILNLLVDKSRTSLDEEDMEFVRDFMEDAADDEDISMDAYPALLALRQDDDSLQDKETAAAPKTKDEAPLSNALTALEALKARIRNSAQKEESAPEKKPESKAVDEQKVEVKKAEKSVPAEAHAEKSPEEISDEILKQHVSVTEKMRLLNSFAAGFYARDDYAAAKYLLTTALRIDDQDGTSIRNMAFTVDAMGDTEKALEFAVKLPVADFAVLAALKK
ncbi:hypothetical protein TAMA11512_22220 [Selenomonas sp. TAMA-11512]|uniref:tetratricopeptide repeat protein n=1 Tax=Selenomonas sp. TAMA-11512 TaxID=3095337 RepID=UPI0030910C99|nr:hypothetical protein TAMA11512_22220 [Selenomonas sp. TAMA-11512]